MRPLTPPSPRKGGARESNSLRPLFVPTGHPRDAHDDRCPRIADGRHRVPVGAVRHGGRADPDRRAAGLDAAADRDGAACDHADGVERLARASLAGAYPLAAGVRLSDRLRADARAVVDHALRAGQAGRALDARRHAVHGADDASGHQAEPRQHWEGHVLRLDLHGVDADDRRLRPADGYVLPRRPVRPARDRGDESNLPGREPFHKTRLFRRHHRPGRHARSGAGRHRNRGLDARHQPRTPPAGGDERPAIPHLGDAADHHHRLLLHRLWRLAAGSHTGAGRLRQGRFAMSETADPPVLDFVEWVAREPRAYAEVIATWKTSCPRLTIWEDAADRGYVARETQPGLGLIIAVTENGERLLRTNGR